MQLEFNFENAKDLQTTMADFCQNMYSVLVWMQILSDPA